MNHLAHGHHLAAMIAVGVSMFTAIAICFFAAFRGRPTNPEA
jgi:hypothetical protein